MCFPWHTSDRQYKLYRCEQNGNTANRDMYSVVPFEAYNDYSEASMYYVLKVKMSD